MRNKTLRLFTAMIVNFGMVSICIADEPAQSPLTVIQNENAGQAVAAAEAGIQNRRQEEGVLIESAEILFAKQQRTEEDEWRLIAIIKTLGDIGEGDAANFLVKYITFHPNILMLDIRAPRIRDTYPSVGGLIDIGIPTLPEIVRLLSTSTDDLAVQLARNVLHSIGVHAHAVDVNSSLGNLFAKQFLEAALSVETRQQESNLLQASVRFFAERLEKGQTGEVR